MRVWVFHGFVISISFFVEIESVEESAAFGPFSSEVNWGISFECTIAISDCYLG